MNNEVHWDGTCPDVNKIMISHSYLLMRQWGIFCQSKPMTHFDDVNSSFCTPHYLLAPETNASSAGSQCLKDSEDDPWISTVKINFNDHNFSWPQKASNNEHYLCVCAKVKHLCMAMLRFTRSLRNSRGEWRGEFRGESQEDILGDPQGEPDIDCGLSWMGWGLLSGKEPASPELPERASLMLLCKGWTKPDLLCSSLSPER